MIIPGFGMISHVMATFSGKPVFGFHGSLKLLIAENFTICRDGNF